MTRILSKAAAIALLAGLSAQPALAQDNVISAAKAAGTVGEQADGYLGIKGTVGADVRAAVDALNIKRRAAYTDLAAKKNVTVQVMAATTGCQTLATRVQAGQIYRIGTGDWQVKGGGAIALPDYCAAGGN
ncbi:MAG: YdbL family protein [Sphingobium sp.]|nr:YdbL family protein [Sphingobium sp.]